MKRIKDSGIFENVNFPHDEFRDGLSVFDVDYDQGSLADDIARFADRNEKNVYFLKGSTGIGKTDLTMLAGLRSSSTERIFYTAGTKYLQRQGHSVAKKYSSINSDVECMRIRGRSNYECLKRDGRDASQCVANRFRHCQYKPSRVDSPPSNREYVSTRSGMIKAIPDEMCPYYEQKMSAIPRHEDSNTRLIVMTTQYLVSEALFAREIRPCDMLIADEAGNLEQEIISCTSIDINEDYLGYVFGGSYTIDLRTTDFDEVREWLVNLYNDLDERIDELQKDIETLDSDVSNRPKESVEGDKYSKERRLESCSRLAEKVELVADRWDPQNLVIDVTNDKSSFSGDVVKKLRVRFVDVQNEFNDLFNGVVSKDGTVAMMSATLPPIDYMLNVFGIEDRKYRYDVVKSNWDKSNRPVVLVKNMKLNSRNIDDRKFDMFDNVEDVVDYAREIDENMIIHTHTHKLKQFFAEGLDPDGKEGFVISHDMDSHDRSSEKAINMFRESDGGKVLISPSAYEGVDFPGDICRLQMSVKVPYPSMADKWIKKKMEKYDKFLPIYAQRSLEQMIGRIIRSEDDEGLTIIMDSSVIGMLAQLELESEHWDNLIGFKSDEVITPSDVPELVEDYFEGDGLKRWKSFGYGQGVDAEERAEKTEKLSGGLKL